MRIPVVLIASCVALGWPVAAQEPAQEEAARGFFDRYLRLGEAYDPAVAEMYSEAATIRVLRRYPQLPDRTMEMTGRQWKSLVSSAMPLAKAQGDRSTFTDVTISLQGTRARIDAERYSVLKCYVDSGYYMVIERQPDGTYLIVKEYLETQPQSDC